MPHDKKLVQLTREDFEKSRQQMDMVKRWMAEMAITGQAPVCLITVNSEGKKFVHTVNGIDFKKLALILNHIAGQLKFMQPPGTKAN